MIELGCGPFTNARLFVNYIPSIEEVTLEDPLLNSYLKHPHCAYKDGTLGGKKTKLASVSIEDLDDDQKYDVVMIINVLEHCKNIPSILSKVEGLMKKDTIFVFSDMMLNIEEIKRMTAHVWDAGHPIRIAKHYMENFLGKFETLFRRDNDLLLNQDMSNGYHKAIWFYFIGKYKGNNG
jgi:ubiquinone/menaquinone biosynthesis C-methylase UbiE